MASSEAGIARPSQLGERLAKQRKRVGGHLEAEHLPARLGVPRIIGRVAWSGARDEGLAQPRRCALRHLQPRGVA